MSAAAAVLASLAVAVWLGLPRPAPARADDVLARTSPRQTMRLLHAHEAVQAPAARVVARVRAHVGSRGRREREQARAVEACTVLAGELRAGRAPAQALAAAAEVGSGPTGQALHAAAAAAALGGDVPAALAVPEASAVPGLLRGLGACWTVCASTGSGLAAAVERVGEAERAAVEQRRAVQVELAGPRATARLLALLPVAGLLMAGGLGAQPLSFLLGTGVGRACLLAGLGLQGLGLRWTGRMTAGAARHA